MAIENRAFSIPSVYSKRVWQDGVFQYATSQKYVGTSGNLVRNSKNTPGYKLKKLTGKLPENTFGFSETTISRTIGVRDSRQVDLSGTETVTLENGRLSGLYPSLRDLVNEVNLENAVLAALYQDMKAIEVDLGVAAAEGKETIRMYSSFARTVRASVSAVRRGDLQGLRNILGFRSLPMAARQPGNLWLAWSYGVNPHIQDLKGSVRALERGLVRESFVVARKRRRVVETEVVVSPLPYPFTGTQTETHTHLCESSIRLKYAVTSPYTATLSSLGLTNPFSTGWEAVRLSFVLDWGIGIGDWLSSLDASFGKTLEVGSKTLFQRRQAVRDISETARVNYFYCRGSSKSSQENVACNRFGLVSFPIQWLPVIKDRHYWQQVASASALFQQMRLRR